MRESRSPPSLWKEASAVSLVLPLFAFCRRHRLEDMEAIDSIDSVNTLKSLDSLEYLKKHVKNREEKRIDSF